MGRGVRGCKHFIKKKIQLLLLAISQELWYSSLISVEASNTFIYRNTDTNTDANTDANTGENTSGNTCSIQTQTYNCSPGSVSKEANGEEQQQDLHDEWRQCGSALPYVLPSPTHQQPPKLRSKTPTLYFTPP